jgi:hypothetical protein
MIQKNLKFMILMKLFLFSFFNINACEDIIGEEKEKD